MSASPGGHCAPSITMRSSTLLKKVGDANSRWSFSSSARPGVPSYTRHHQLQCSHQLVQKVGAGNSRWSLRMSARPGVTFFLLRPRARSSYWSSRMSSQRHEKKHYWHLLLTTLYVDRAERKRRRQFNHQLRCSHQRL